MKFINKTSGVILEPKNGMVLEQLRKSEAYEAYEGQGAAQSGEKSLDKKTKSELLKAAQDAGIEVPDSATKADIIDLIQAHGDE